MKTSAVIPIIACALAGTPVSHARPIDGHNNGGNVTWGDGPHGPAVQDRIPRAMNALNVGVVCFEWTAGVDANGVPVPHTAFRQYCETNSDPDGDRAIRFSRPPTPPLGPDITDWKQFIGKRHFVGHPPMPDPNTPDTGSCVRGGNIVQNSPWSFRPLSELDGFAGRIPDLGPLAGDGDPGFGQTIYTAVNLGLYLSANPNGFLGGAWADGQTINELGIHIVNGQIAGLQGIYFATTDFIIDPNSATGWVPAGGPGALLNSDNWQAQFGDISIVGQHVVPAPGACTTLIAVIALSRRRRSR